MNKEISLQGHEHPLSLVNRGDRLDCDACDGAYRGGYFCGECKFTVHKKCAFVFNTQETLFDHPCHVGHRLKLLTTGAPDHTDPKCHICGKNTKRLLFHCSICKLNLDIDCMVDALCARSYLNMPWHPHPLLVVNFNGCLQCDSCGLRFRNGYFCARCRLMVHEKCVSIFDTTEITHTAHTRHSLKLLTQGAPEYTDRKCHVCEKDIGNLLYHCDNCKFNLDVVCATKKTHPPVSLSNLKVHEHMLTLMPRLISFICDACGMKGDRAPYVCLQCDFMIHGDCATLPRVIHINRHDHRISYTYPLGPGEWRCGVCWEDIDWSCGAYYCSKCPSYAVHSRCAIRKDVWDGKELDGVIEEAEDLAPFRVNKDKTITHFLHEHRLSLNKDGISLEEEISCGACVRPIGSKAFYNCSFCSFMLHESCANLAKKTRHFLSPTPLTLVNAHPSNGEPIRCSACLQHMYGFIYMDHRCFDLQCSSITEPFIHGCHPHPLLYIKVDPDDESVKTCQGCGMHAKEMVLGCIKCKFYLDFRCATLPLSVRLHRYDDHPLALCYGEKARGKYWCDICERETDPETWFYTCKDCGVTLHILCVLGDLKCGTPIDKRHSSFVLSRNNRSSRPICNNCHCRCPGLFILEDYNKNQFYCSFYCHTRFNEWWKNPKDLPQRSVFSRRAPLRKYFLDIPPWVNEPEA